MALGAGLVVAAVFCFAAQYLAPVTVSLEQELVPNARNASWALALYPLATPLLAAGLSLLMFVMFMISRLSAERESRIRTCLGAFGAGLLMCGVVAPFSRQIFPTPMGPVMIVDAETGLPSSYVLSLPLSLALPEIAPALLWVGLLVIAALVSVPRLWRFTETEQGTDDADVAAHQAFSRARAIKAGALFVALAIAAGFAPQIFPSVAARTVVSEGGITMLQPWTETVPVLAPCLLAAGLTVLAVGVLSTTVRAVLAGRAQEPPSDVEG
ncbi:hypothetical protein MB46_14135 [Arthrobacter alpinus]|uniref:hypothetical protein n=1 Tax=Arthrobacter alpinus TaxID=656366 RepID=UPI0005CAD915|nr:hypothetical protein [Arthrobacter alpinus]ALV46456.1 hypothetical protein MB46_14135 [Arthrobacter alpinus]